MRWLAFAYSLSDTSSSRRVAVWRRLRQLGSVAPAGLVHLLPDGDEAREAFGWLAQEIRDGGGQALVMETELQDSERAVVVEAFRAARDEDYRKIAEEAEALVLSPDRARLEKLRRRFDEVSRIDFYAAPEGPRAAAALARLAPESEGPEVPEADPSLYRGRTWVTRPRPHVDRLASAWLIRRFIDPEAVIRYWRAPGGRGLLRPARRRARPPRQPLHLRDAARHLRAGRPGAPRARRDRARDRPAGRQVVPARDCRDRRHPPRLAHGGLARRGAGAAWHRALRGAVSVAEGTGEGRDESRPYKRDRARRKTPISLVGATFMAPRGWS